jgi:hypothetical protein
MGCRAGQTPSRGRQGPISRACGRYREISAAAACDAVSVQIAEVVEGLRDRIARGRDHGGGVAVGAAGGLPQDLVDHTESQHVLGRDLHAVGDFLGLGAVAVRGVVHGRRRGRSLPEDPAATAPRHAVIGGQGRSVDSA